MVIIGRYDDFTKLHYSDENTTLKDRSKSQQIALSRGIVKSVS